MSERCRATAAPPSLRTPSLRTHPRYLGTAASGQPQLRIGDRIVSVDGFRCDAEDQRVHHIIAKRGDGPYLFIFERVLHESYMHAGGQTQTPSSLGPANSKTKTKTGVSFNTPILGRSVSSPGGSVFSGLSAWGGGYSRASWSAGEGEGGTEGSQGEHEFDQAMATQVVGALGRKKSLSKADVGGEMNVVIRSYT